MSQATTEPKNRLLFLDQFRGLAILLMVFANSPEHYRNVSRYLKHAPSYSFHLPDIVAPMFLFAIGYAAELSFQSRRRKNGVPKTVLHFLTRNLILFACGFSGTLMVQRESLGHPGNARRGGASGAAAVVPQAGRVAGPSRSWPRWPIR